MSHKKKKIMLIDDEEDFLEVAALNLTDTGQYEVRTVWKGIGVIKHLHEFRPDLVLLDMVMPDITGVDICKLFHDDPIGKTTPIVVLSALEKYEEKLKAFNLGIVGYINKPIDKGMLIQVIESTLKMK